MLAKGAVLSQFQNTSLLAIHLHFIINSSFLEASVAVSFFEPNEKTLKTERKRKERWQWLSAQAVLSQPGLWLPCTPRGFEVLHWGCPVEKVCGHFRWSRLGGGVLVASAGYKPGVVLSRRQCSEASGPSASSAPGEKTCPRTSSDPPSSQVPRPSLP